MTGCYYRRLGREGDEQSFESTDLTRSNWDPAIQHGSPPLALLVKAIEELSAATGQRIGRVTLDILGAIPVEEVGVRVWVDRPGKRIATYVAEMRVRQAGAVVRPVARVTAWLLASSDTADVATDRYPPLAEGPAADLPPMFDDLTGYLQTIDWRRQLTQSGEPSVFWVSPTARVVDAEPDTSLVKLAAVVDSCNGIGAVLDYRRFTFMNTDTVVHLHRLPVGDDFGLRARGSVGPDGVGVTSAEIFDRDGFIGVCAQTVLIQRRP